MVPQTFYKFLIPTAILSSVFIGPAYNLLIFLNTHILESHWSIYIDNVAFANLMALSFILFTIIFIISSKFVEKLTKEPLIITGIIIIAFSCIYAGLTWVWEIVILAFIITSSTIAFLIPVIIKYTSDKIEKKYENKLSKFVLPISTLLWIMISFALFTYIGDAWRLLYFVAGGINIISAIVIGLI